MQSNDENFMKIYDQAEKFIRDNAVLSPIVVKPCSSVPKTFARGCPGPDTLIDPPPSSTGIASTSSKSSSTKS
ncbi:unnamed protein product [Sphagnum balticum]